MKKIWDYFFPPKRGKDKVKNHQSCDFGIKEFNKGKRSKAFVEEANLKQHGHGKPVPPPPDLPPPPPSTETGVILLVFDGAVVSGTSWNYNGDIVCEYSGLTTEEQQTILAAVQDDYKGFNVIITTDKLIYNATSAARRSMIIITETYEWYGQAGGVSFINSFGTSNGISFVFSSLLGYNVKYIQDALSHEAGHQFNCYHQSVWGSNCVKTAEYRPGVIMGVGYYVANPPFTVGTSSISCTDIQDDAAKIKLKLG